MEENQNTTQLNQTQNQNQEVITNNNPQPHHTPHNSFSNTNYNNIDLSLNENKKEENDTTSFSYKPNQDYEIKVELDKNKNNKKFNSYTNNYSKSPSYRNNKNINNHNINKKPYFTHKSILLNKYSLKEVNECISKDYAQLEKILPYYQNYYFQNKINNSYNNYNNYRNNYNSTNNINNNNDVILICLKYIEFSNFFFNNYITFKVQNLLFSIINGDRHILEQNKYSFLKNKLNEVYNKLMPYQIRYNYLKAFYDRNPDRNLYYLFKKDLDKVSLSKPIDKKNLNYLYEIFEIVKQRMETKKDSIKMYINRLFNSINSNINNSNNKNGGYYNNSDSLNNNNSDLDMSNSNDYTSYNPRRYSLHYTSSQNNNLSSYKNTKNSSRSNYINGSNRKNIDLNNKEVSQFNINNHNNKGINYKQSSYYYKNNYKTFNNNDRDYIRNKNTKTNKFYKGELVEIEDININKNSNVESENKIDDNNNQNNSNEMNKEYKDFIDINKNENKGNNIYNSNENLNINLNINLNNVKINSLNNENEFNNNINKNECDDKNIINMDNISNQINANNVQNNNGNIISENNTLNNINNIQEEKGEEKQDFINTDMNINSDDGHKVKNSSINDDSMDNGENIKNINADLNIDFLYNNEDKKNNNSGNEPKITYIDFNSSNNSLNMHTNAKNNSSNNLINTNINNANNNGNQNNPNTMNKLKLNNIINNINNLSNLNININDKLKNIFLLQSFIFSSMDKIIPQFNQMMTLNNYQNNLNNNFNVINKYNLGISNNLSYNLNPFNTHNNKNHNIHNNPYEIIRHEYLKLKSLQKEKPQEIKYNMDLFEYNILLPIYNEVNSNNNNSEIVSKYSKVYLKYREAIESILNKNNLEGTIVEPYGSIVNNFLTKDGDIDISIVPCNKSKDEFLDYLKEIREELINVRKYAVENQDIYINNRYILLSIMDIETKISIDITVHNLLPINNSKMIRLYSLFDQRFHILGIFLKHWVKINNIKGAPNGYLSSYALLILIIHFLQNIVEPKVLPVLQEIKKETIEYKYHNGEIELTTNLYYEQDFDKMKEYMNVINCGNENESTVTELLMQFFEYYSYIYNCNNNHYLISIKHSDKKPAINCKQYAFPIEDPFDLSHNPGKSLKVDSEQLYDFILCMQKEINNIMSGEYFKNTTVFG